MLMAVGAHCLINSTFLRPLQNLRNNLFSELISLYNWSTRYNFGIGWSCIMTRIHIPIINIWLCQQENKRLCNFCVVDLQNGEETSQMLRNDHVNICKPVATS